MSQQTKEMSHSKKINNPNQNLRRKTSDQNKKSALFNSWRQSLDERSPTSESSKEQSSYTFVATITKIL